MAAFAAGKHVLTEKPITATPSEADRMVSAAAEAGVKLGVVYQNRFRPELIRIKEMIDGGEFGELYRTVLDAASYRSQAYYDSGGWRGTWDGEGGGVLLNQGIHFIDYFQWLGGMPVALTGQVTALMHDIEVEDSASALLEYENGAHGFLHCSTVQAPSQTRLELWGEKCGVVVTDDDATLYRPEVGLLEFSERERDVPFSKPEIEVLPLEPGVSAADHIHTIDDFAQAIIDDRVPAAPGEEGVKGLELGRGHHLLWVHRREGDLPARPREVRQPARRAESGPTPAVVSDCREKGPVANSWLTNPLIRASSLLVSLRLDLNPIHPLPKFCTRKSFQAPLCYR